MKRSAWLLLIFPITLVVYACQDREPAGVSAPQVGAPMYAIDYLVEGWLFLPPIGSGSSSGGYIGTLSPEVVVCQWNGSACQEPVLAKFTKTVGTGGATIQVTPDGSYQVDWNTNFTEPNTAIVETVVYKIVVKLQDVVLGTADIALFTSVGQAKKANGDYIALHDGRTLPIKFGVTFAALLDILDLNLGTASADFTAKTFTTTGGTQTAVVPSGNAAFEVDGPNVKIDGGGTEFTLLIAKKELDANGKCEAAYGGPQKGHCYIFETIPANVRFEFSDESPAGKMQVCPDGDKTGFDLAKFDDGFVTFPPPPPNNTNVVPCPTFVSRLPAPLRHLARLVLPRALYADDEGETGMVGNFSTGFWAMPLEVQPNLLPTGPVGPDQEVTLSFKVVREHGTTEGTTVDGAAIDFSADGGTLDFATKETSGGGLVAVKWKAPTGGGPYTIKAKVAGTPELETLSSFEKFVATVQAGVSVSGTVFYSTSGLSGVTVELVQGAVTNTPLRSTTTDGTGAYSFSNVADGTYWVKTYGLDASYITWVAQQINVAGMSVAHNVDLPKDIALLSPASGATVSTANPTLTWTANPQAVRYVLQLNVTNPWTLVEQQTNLTSASYTVGTALTSGVNYTWQVDAFDAANHRVGTTENQFNFTVSLASGSIIFTSDRDGQSSGFFDLFVMGADGSNQVNITNTPGNVDGQGYFSPDGSKVVFTSSRSGDGLQIWVMNADGSNPIQLTHSSGNNNNPAWSPDGTKIVFHTHRDGNAEIYVMNADGTGETNLTNNADSDQFPKWSPDGTKIVFTRELGTNAEIFVMNSDGTGQVNISNHASADDFLPDWSPDGTKIAFVRGPADIWVMNADGTGAVNLTPGQLGSDTYPAWSPDGSKIAFMSERDGGNREIYVMNADGTNPVRLTNNPAQDIEPRWKPQPPID